MDICNFFDSIKESKKNKGKKIYLLSPAIKLSKSITRFE